jgi:TonB family protein
MGSTRSPYLLGLVLGLSTCPAFAQESGEGSVPRGGPGAVVKPPEEQPPAEAAKPVVVMPELVTFVDAPYPPEAQSAGVEGSVVLKLTIDRDGNVSEAEVLEPAGHGFDEAAREAALKFKFKPATRNGAPVPVSIKYRYDFTLKVAAPAEQAPAAPTTGNLGGTLRIAGSDAPLVGAEVVITLKDGTGRKLVTDEQGRFELTGLPPGRYQVKVLAEGFDPIESTEEVVAGEATDVTLRAATTIEGVIDVVVTGQRPPREVTRRTVERREIERIPGTGGDALRSIQSLPGVARPPGIAGLLIVRGSAPNGTGTFVDGSDIPNIYHFGGLSSVIPTELLDRIDFYPGNFSVRYGRFNGGIVDVALLSPETRCFTDNGKIEEGKTGCYHGLVQADLIDTRFLVQGPLGPLDNWSFALAGRRSWIDTWLKPALEEAGAGVTSAPVYYDYQAIAEYKQGTTRNSFRVFGSDDRFEILIKDPASQDPAFGGNLSLSTSFVRGQFVHSSELSRNVTLDATLSIGSDSTAFSIGNFFFELNAIPITARSEFGFSLARGVKLYTGLDFVVAPYEVRVRFPDPPRPGEPDPGPFATRPPRENDEDGTVFRPAWYAELELQPTERLRLVPGARVDYARDSGHTDLSPRINGRYDLVMGATGEHPDRRRTTLKGGVGLFHQPPDFQETDEVFGTPGIDSNRAVHYSLGVEQEFTRQVELSLEGFYKDLTDQVSRVGTTGGAYVYGNEGSGHVIGLETLLKYKPDERFFGWVAYTLSRSVVQDGPDLPEYLFQYDQTHNLIILGSYRLGRGWEFGARFRVVSGSLQTPVVGPPSLPSLYASDAGSYAPLQGAPFSERLPLFHQLDLRVDKRWQMKGWKLSAYLDVQNVYNNAAPEAYVYSYDFSERQIQTGIPIIPSIGLRGEL